MTPIGATVQDDQFFKELIDNLTEGVYFLDRSRRITYWNRGAERLTGYPAAEVLGRFCADGLLQHMDPTGRLLCNDGCPMEAAMREGRERAAEVFLHHKKGHRVPITVRAVPIRGISGEIVGAVEVFSSSWTWTVSRASTTATGTRRATTSFASSEGRSQMPRGRAIFSGAGAARSFDTVASLVARADSRMYEAKKQGRNRVVDDADATS